MFKYILISCLVLFSLVSFQPQRLEADSIQISLLTPQQTISLFARQYGANEKELLLVSQCESNFKPTAVGDHGKARNIFQYHKQTFEMFSLLVGETLDYNSYADQAKLTAEIFAQYPKLREHWTCWRMLQKKKGRF